MRGDELRIKTISDLSADAKEALQKIECLLDDGVIIHIEDMGTIDDSPAGKQLLNTLASVLSNE